MAVLKADGTRVTKAQLTALTTDVTPAAVAQLQVNEVIYQDYKTSPKEGSAYNSQQKILFNAGQVITQTELDAVFPTATASDISPVSGPAAGGTAVTITGTNFDGATGVTFGGTAATAFKLVNNTTITCTTPAKIAGAVTVVIQDDNADLTKAAFYTYV